MSKIILGEKPFFSIQGEAERAGMLTIFVRFFGCNLKCAGFAQKDPTDSLTYDLGHLKGEDYTGDLNDLPVFPTGCDSAYSWHKNFKKSSLKYTVKELVDEIYQCGSEFGMVPNSWVHPNTNMPIQLCFTGGEPMLQQSKMIEILEEIESRRNPDDQVNGLRYITIETNGTQPIEPEFVDKVAENLMYHFLFACSPKLHAVSGEKNAIKYSVLSEYGRHSDGILKFVMNNSEKSWAELDEIMKELANIPEMLYWSFWVMPVGANHTDEIEEISLRAMRRGINLTARQQIYLFGNKVGT